MYNFLKETIEALVKYGYTVADVKCVVDASSGKWITWTNFEKRSKFFYQRTGIDQIMINKHIQVILNDDSKLIRHVFTDHEG